MNRQEQIVRILKQLDEKENQTNMILENIDQERRELNREMASLIQPVKKPTGRKPIDKLKSNILE